MAGFWGNAVSDEKLVLNGNTGDVSGLLALHCISQQRSPTFLGVWFRPDPNLAAARFL